MNRQEQTLYHSLCNALLSVVLVYTSRLIDLLSSDVFITCKIRLPEELVTSKIYVVKTSESCKYLVAVYGKLGVLMFFSLYFYTHSHAC